MHPDLKKTFAVCSIVGLLSAGALAISTPATAGDYEDDWTYRRADDNYGAVEEHPHCHHHGFYTNDWDGRTSTNVDVGVATTAGPEDPDNYAGSCRLAYRQLTDDWGDFVGYRQVRVCD